MAKTPSAPRSSTSRSQSGTGPALGSDRDQGPQEPMDPAQEALFREVEEDLRAEQMRALWKRFGPYVIGTAVLIVAIVAGMQGWQAWQASVQAGEAERYHAAVTGQGDQPDLAALQALADDGRTGYAPLAALVRANALAGAGDPGAAIDAYDALSTDGAAPGPVRHLATMAAALLAMEVEEPGSIRGRLAPLTDDDSPWRYMAREMLGVLAMQAGDTEAARRIFNDLRDVREAPPGVRSRASELLAMLGGPPDGADGSDGAATGSDDGAVDPAPAAAAEGG